MPGKELRKSNWVRRVTHEYLQLHGYKIMENVGSQVIVNTKEQIIYCYNNIPSPLYMQKFNHLSHLSKQQDSECRIFHDIEAFKLQNRYRDAANLTVQRKPFTFKDVVCKIVKGGVETKIVHDADNYPDNGQIEVFLNLPPAKREQILEKLMGAIGDKPTSATMQVLLEEIWWDEHISGCMDFLGF